MLKERVVSALTALALLALAIYFLPKEALRWIVLAIWALGAWEWSGFLRPNVPSLRMVYTLWLTGMMLLIALGYLDATASKGLLVMGLIFWLFNVIQLLRYPIPISKPFILLAGVFALVPSYAAFDYLLKAQSLWYVLFLLLIIWAADVGAYFAGKKFGKIKLAPRVSPGKTREGAFGGWLLAVIVALIGGSFLFQNYTLAAVFRMIGAATGIFALSVVGDLTASMFKRNRGLKDSGVFLPGHGGVLDRIDSWCAGAVLFALIILLFH